MAKVEGVRFGRLVKIDNPDEGIAKSRQHYVGTEGLIVICESEHKAPGKRFIRYFPYEDSMTQRYLITTLGDIDRTDEGLTLTTETTVYGFIDDNSLSENEKIDLILNVFVRI